MFNVTIELMRISSISDVHVVNDQDDRAKVLKSFLTNEKVLNSDYVIFLGDVFDCLVGEQEKQLVNMMKYLS